jgi:sialic acid synthase SpsE
MQNDLVPIWRAHGSDGAFLIAEAGINHNGHFDLALELVRRAKAAGADCVKFQTFRTDACESRHSSMPGYFAGRIGDMTKLEWSRSLEFSRDQFRDLREACRREGIAFLSTACDVEGLKVLADIGAEAVKIASADCVNLYLLRAVAETGLPVLLSTGMTDLDEVSRAVEVLLGGGTAALCLLQCTSQYPAPYDQIHLRAMATLRERFGVPVGLSDHSPGIHIPMAAAALGAAVVEKHFTLSRELPGVDHAASLNPDEFQAMATGIREVEAALGDPEKRLQQCERGNIEAMRKSLMAARPIPAGKVIELDDLAAKRPGGGMPPSRLGEVLGKRAASDIAPEDFITPSLLQDA